MAEDISISYCSTDYAIAAYVDGRIVGVFKYDLGPGRTLIAKGTAVAKRLKRRGIARALWMSALRRHNPKFVDVVTVSASGHTLVASLKKAFPRIKFEEVKDYCG